MFSIGSMGNRPQLVQSDIAPFRLLCAKILVVFRKHLSSGDIYPLDETDVSRLPSISPKKRDFAPLVSCRCTDRKITDRKIDFHSIGADCTKRGW
jgi:hypothetical protein